MRPLLYLAGILVKRHVVHDGWEGGPRQQHTATVPTAPARVVRVEPIAFSCGSSMGERWKAAKAKGGIEEVGRGGEHIETARFGGERGGQWRE